MKSSEFCQLNEDNVAELLASRNQTQTGVEDRRKSARWPFPGTAVLSIPREDGTEDYVLATSLDLGPDGVGIRCERPLKPGLELSIALHEPEKTFHGRARVRHCTEMEDEFLIGMQFISCSG